MRLTDRASESRLLPLLFGTVAMACGVAAILRPDEIVRVLAFVFGVHLVCFGSFQLVRSVTADRPGRSRGPGVVGGAASAIAGVLCLRDLGRAAFVLGVLFGLFWLMAGTAELIAAVVALRPGKAVSAILGVVVGILLLAVPAPSLFWMTVLLGVLMAVVGAVAIVEAATIPRTGALPNADG
jgi:hypothetical protein